MTDDVRAGDITERRLVHGWPSTARVRIRLATATDLPEAHRLASLTGFQIEDPLRAAITADTAGAGIRVALRSGPTAFAQHMTNRLAEQPPDQPFLAYLQAALILVAEHRDAGVVGTVVVSPAPYLVSALLQQNPAGFHDRGEQHRLIVRGALYLAVIRAVAVDERVRGRNIGGSLLKRVRQVYQQCGYRMMYALMRRTPALEAFYRRHRFHILTDGQPLDLHPVLGYPCRVRPSPDECIAVWQ